MEKCSNKAMALGSLNVPAMKKPASGKKRRTDSRAMMEGRR